ncbi:MULTISPECIES: LytR C-terminal domain-containing protein [Arthrobacter]|uniref:LytR family transcriptional regulator n=1 Tax=Arthrobacter oryzae TaxID=409290 RepID=A0A3N0BXY3_9MICC|nr:MULTISPECIES: LytR C-terminal domain-containing protein [Arthrobacter]QYF91228.1 LytR C-terminal domain-containing protein [Arthrobacter sp. PAMC25284]RNL54372.1 LytR family transcriptional regulator [Arthrobacter oryzae]
MTKYARDEFDRVPETSTRQGVHRAVTEARRRSLVPILSLGGIALVIGILAFVFLPKLGFAPAGDAAVAAAQSGASASASQAPTASATETPGAVPPAAPSDPTPSASVPGAESNAPAVDKTQPVTIYNGTTTAGLASRAGATVAGGGWTLGTLGNWPGVPQSTSVIFYNGPDQKDNAEALSDLLGIPETLESADFNVPLVVVLGPGFQ